MDRITVLRLIVIIAASFFLACLTDPETGTSLGITLGIDPVRSGEPDMVSVTVSSNNFSYYVTKDMRRGDGDRLIFTDIPEGQADVSIEVLHNTLNDQYVPFMTGFAVANLVSGKQSTITIPLTVQLQAPFISDTQSDQFDKESAGTSPFWDDLERTSWGFFANEDDKFNATMRSAVSGTHLYFYFIINDDNFDPSINTSFLDGLGEWDQDALVIYLAKLHSVNDVLSDDGLSTINAFHRIMLTTALVDPAQARISVETFNPATTGATVVPFSDQNPVEVKIIEPDPKTRVIEMRIPRTMIGKDLVYGERLALAIRYRNSDPDKPLEREVVKWKQTPDNNPKTSLDAWGNLQF